MLDWLRIILCKPCDFPDVAPMQLRFFETEYELRRFLRQDMIDRLKYVKKVHDCDDFAHELKNAAREKGYEMWVYPCEKDAGWHCQNCTLIGNWYFLIEPQTDEIVKLIRRD